MVAAGGIQKELAETVGRGGTTSGATGTGTGGMLGPAAVAGGEHGAHRTGDATGRSSIGDNTHTGTTGGKLLSFGVPASRSLIETLTYLPRIEHRRPRNLHFVSWKAEGRSPLQGQACPSEISKLICRRAALRRLKASPANLSRQRRTAPSTL